MMKLLNALILLFLLLLPALPLGAETLSGKVIGISDGDTITILKDKTQMKIRLYGIDAPEKSQAFGTKSKQYLSDLIFGKEVRVKTYRNDRYGRTLGEIYVGEGRLSVNAEMVKAGFAWWYQKYTPERLDLKALEDEARKERRGLWADPHAIPPWEFRRK